MKKKSSKAPLNFHKIFDFRYFFHDIVRATGFLQLVIWYRLKKHFVSDKAKRDARKLEPYLIISNHHKFSDALVIMNSFWYRRVPFIIQNGVFQNKSSFFLRWHQCIEINRENVEFSSFKRCFEAFRMGHCVGIFPEGHFVSDDTIESFKNGSSLIAWKSNVKILPVYIPSRKSRWNRQHIVIGEAINPNDIIKTRIPNITGLQELTDYTFNKMNELRMLYIEQKGIANENKEN